MVRLDLTLILAGGQTQWDQGWSHQPAPTSDTKLESARPAVLRLMACRCGGSHRPLLGFVNSPACL